MHKIFVSCLVVVAAMLLAMPALAMEFQPIGSEAASMGGAGVASAKGSYAPYYNPALLAEHRHGMQISLSGGVGIREVNLADRLDTLSDIEVGVSVGEINDTPDLNADGTAVIAGLSETDKNNITTMKNELRALSDKNGLQIMPTASLGVQVGSFGFGAYGVSEATAHAVVDPNRLDIIVEIDVPSGAPAEFGTGSQYVKYDETTDEFTPSSLDEYTASSFEYALNNNLTYVKLTGLAYAEIPIAYGRQFSTAWGKLDYGGSFKIMLGRTYDEIIDIDTDSDDVDTELEDIEHRDDSWGVDLGLLFKPSKLPKLSVGLVGKNLNTPEFDTKLGNTLKVDPQVRVGFAYDLMGDRLTFALDADLTNNDTFILNYSSQFIGGGVNFHPFNWLSLRAGLMKNIQESDDGNIWTAGLGLGLKWFQLDVTGQLSDEKSNYEVEGTELRRYARVQLAMVSKWF